MPTFFFSWKEIWKGGGVCWIPALQSYCCKSACFKEGDRYRDLSPGPVLAETCLTKEFG